MIVIFQNKYMNFKQKNDEHLRIFFYRLYGNRAVFNKFISVQVWDDVMDKMEWDVYFAILQNVHNVVQQKHLNYDF